MSMLIHWLTSVFKIYVGLVGVYQKYCKTRKRQSFASFLHLIFECLFGFGWVSMQIGIIWSTMQKSCPFGGKALNNVSCLCSELFRWWLHSKFNISLHLFSQLYLVLCTPSLLLIIARDACVTPFGPMPCVFDHATLLPLPTTLFFFLLSSTLLDFTLVEKPIFFSFFWL